MADIGVTEVQRLLDLCCEVPYAPHSGSMQSAQSLSLSAWLVHFRLTYLVDAMLASHGDQG